MEEIYEISDLYTYSCQSESIQLGVMKPKCRHNSDDIQRFSSLSVSSVGIASLVLILTTLDCCEAQTDTPAISVVLPVVIVAVVGCIMFFIICACVCTIVCFTANRSTQSNLNARTVQYTYSQQQRSQVVGPGRAYPVQGQRYPQSSAPYLASKTAPEPPVSLPEATLHQGDAPPGYEEAIRMKTVDNVVVTS